MAKTKISEFSTTPGNNTDINGINIAEGCAPSGINNAIRELMSDLKEWQSGAMDVYVIPQGTAAAPGIQLYGDLDTGLYGFAANQLGVAVGGASAGYFSSDGWVGNVVATTVDLTNIEVTNIKAKDGTTSISLADSTGIATFSKATVIETTDNTNAALRITQLGTGNALLVEDATNPDTTPTVIDQFGNVILGTTARTTPVTSKVEIHSTSSENLGLTPSLGFYNWSATASSASHLTFRHYPSGTVGTLAANTSGDVLGRVVFLSYDGTNAFSASIIGVSGAGGASPSISYTAAGGHNFSSGVVSVSTQLNADNLRLDGNTISSTDTDGNIVISPNGTGDVQIDADTVRVGDSNANVTITTNGTGDLTLNTNSGTSSGYIQILDGANGNIGIVPDGTGIVYLSSSTVVTGNANPSTKITTLGTSDLTLDTNEGFESGSIFIENGVNGDIIITPDGTGKTQISGTLDVTTIEATNIRAKDGTASIVLTDVSGAVDISKAVTFSTTTETIALGTSQTTGTFTVGGTAQTGTQTFDQSTKTHTLNLGTGATESGLTKTINLGTGGVSTSTTAINIGSANGTTTTVSGAFVANGGAVFNENGADVDFRVEGDTDANLIFADASTDRVGIGTNAPSFKLSVAANTASELAIQAVNSGIGNTGYRLQNSLRSWAIFVNDDSSGPLRFYDYTAVAERMRIDSSGNLGIGVTPSAWKSEFKVLQLNARTSLFGSADSTFLTTNEYIDSAGTSRYIQTGSATRYRQDDRSHIWSYAASGTAGNAITFTQAMTLDASGNLGVGETNPAAGLHLKKQEFRQQFDSAYYSFYNTAGVRYAYIQNNANTTIDYASENGAIPRWIVGGTERARITSGGYFKASNNGNYDNSSGTYHEFYQTANSNCLYLRATNASYTSSVLGVVGDRTTTNGTYNLVNVLNGNSTGQFIVRDSGNAINTNGSYGTISDQRLKQDIVDAGSQWEDLKAIRFRKYRMKADVAANPDAPTMIGVVAQELEQTSPGLVETTADRDAEGNDLGTTTKSVKTSVLLMKAAVALQEAMARIEKLEAEVAALKGV